MNAALVLFGPALRSAILELLVDQSVVSRPNPYPIAIGLMLISVVGLLRLRIERIIYYPVGQHCEILVMCPEILDLLRNINSGAIPN